MGTRRGVVATGRQVRAPVWHRGTHTRDSVEIRGCLPPFLSPSLEGFPGSPRKPEPALRPVPASHQDGEPLAGAAALLSWEPRALPRDMPLNRTRALSHHPQVPWAAGLLLRNTHGPTGTEGFCSQVASSPGCRKEAPPGTRRDKEFQGSSSAGLH